MSELINKHFDDPEPEEFSSGDETIILTVGDTDAGKRLDAYLAEALARTRSFSQKLIEEGKVTRDNKPVNKKDKNLKVQPGMTFTVTIPAPESIDLIPEDIPLDILYEDEDLLVVNKPKGMVVHPAPGNPTGTLVQALLHHCGDSLSGINGVMRPGIVHRIDKDTSGLLIVAKSDRAHVGLAEQIRVHSFTRCYEAIVYGNVKERRGTLRNYLGRSSADRKKMAVVSPLQSDARDAVTHYEVLERFDGFTHVRLQLETGRTHQIRVQMAAIGHPVAGDPLYGPKKVIGELMGQCLHARTIGFVHPVTGEELTFESRLPDYFTDFIGKLRRRQSGLQKDAMEGLLFCVDCDGTLLRRDDSIHPDNIAEIKRFQAAGGRVALATGRPFSMVERFVKKLELTTPCVLLNGGLIYDPVDNRPLWYTEIPEAVKSIVPQVMEDFKEMPGGVPGVEIFTPEMLHPLNWHPYMQWHLIDRFPIPHERITYEDAKNLPWVKFMFLYDDEYMPDLINYLDKQGLHGVKLVRSDKMLYEVLPETSGKGRGVLKLCDLLGVNKPQLIGMGDYDNDKELLTVSGFAITPANAPAHIQALSDLTTTRDNTEGAVGEALRFVIDHRAEVERP